MGYLLAPSLFCIFISLLNGTMCGRGAFLLGMTCTMQRSVLLFTMYICIVLCTYLAVCFLLKVLDSVVQRGASVKWGLPQTKGGGGAFFGHFPIFPYTTSQAVLKGQAAPKCKHFRGGVEWGEREKLQKSLPLSINGSYKHPLSRVEYSHLYIQPV